MTRKEPDADARLAPIVGTDKCGDRMRAAIAMDIALKAGEANNLAEAGRPFGLAVTLACQTLRLLRLAPPEPGLGRVGCRSGGRAGAAVG